MQIRIADLLLAGKFDRRDGKSIQEVKIPKNIKRQIGQKNTCLKDDLATTFTHSNE